MKVYFYDEITKEFTMSADALKDPLESKIQGKDVWLLPANATFDEPLPNKDGYKVVYKDGWKYEEIPQPKPEPEPTLDELKSQKRAEINSARDRTEQGGFEYLGKTFDSDPISCQRISTAAQAMAFAPEETAIVWTCQDNTTISLNKTQLAGLVAALAMHSNTCHQKATALKAEVEKAKSKEELEKITWGEKI
jgi:hypothetical protein|nr:MAG TPA: protein of unknown function (DUF4376) [Caudoviricetes sp.]